MAPLGCCYRPSSAIVRNTLTAERRTPRHSPIFGANLRALLLPATAGRTRVVLGVDPGFRTGCKLAVVDGVRQSDRHSHDLSAPAAESQT
jgi:transcriptional accessory protein Tex/SPT6